MEGVQVTDKTVEFDLLYCPEGNLGEVHAFNFVEYYEQFLQKLDNPTEYNYIFNHKFESNSMHLGHNNEIVFYHLHLFCERNNIDPKNVTFINGNFKIWKHYSDWKAKVRPNSNNINFICIFWMMKFYSEYTFNDYPHNTPDLTSWVKLKNSTIDPDRPMEYPFNCLNRVPRRHRMSLYKRLHEQNLLDKGIVSFNEKRDVCLIGEELSKEQLDLLPIYWDFDHSFKHVNDWILQKVNKHQYEHIDNVKNPHVNDFNNIIENSFITVVPETEYGVPESIEREWCDAEPIGYETYQNGFITEKTFRHIRDGHPLLLVASAYTLDMLRYLGFKTFSPWIDESYDTIVDPYARLDAVVAELKRICELTPEERKQIYKELIPILKHNQQHLFNMKEIPTVNINDWEQYSKNWQFLPIPG